MSFWLEVYSFSYVKISFHTLQACKVSCEKPDRLTEFVDSHASLLIILWGRIQDLEFLRRKSWSTLVDVLPLKSPKYPFLPVMPREWFSTHPVHPQLAVCSKGTDGLLCVQYHLLYFVPTCCGDRTCLVHSGYCGVSAEGVFVCFTGSTSLSPSSLPVSLALCLSNSKIIWPANL